MCNALQSERARHLPGRAAAIRFSFASNQIVNDLRRKTNDARQSNHRSEIIIGKADSPPASKAVLGGFPFHARLGATFCTPWMFVRVNSRTTHIPGPHRLHPGNLGNLKRTFSGSRTIYSVCSSRLTSPSNSLCVSVLTTHPPCVPALKGGYRDFSRRLT
jgi:hypothetical protein